MKILKNLTWILLIILCTSTSPTENTNYNVYSSFTYHFIKYTKWAKTSPEYVIGVYEDGDNLTAFNALSGKVVNEKKIKVLPIVDDTDLTKCHIIFVPKKYNSKLEHINSVAKTSGILVVTDQCKNNGKDINFIVVSNKVKFEIYTKTSKEHNISYSSQLTSIAIMK